MTATDAVLLDLYDTLAWTEWPALRPLIEQRTGVSSERLLEAFDETRPARAVGAYGSMEADLAMVLSSAGLKGDDTLVRNLSQLVSGFLETGVHLWEDSVPTLRALRERGVRTAIVSNCDHGTRPVVERLGLDREADAVILSFEVKVAKPDPGIYRAALAAVGASAEDAVFVDDQADYCDGAEAVGIRPFLMLRDEANPARGVSSSERLTVIRDLGSLLELL